MNSSVKAALILVVVFAIGGLTGFVVNESIERRSEERPIGPRLDPFRLEEGVIDHIQGRLTKVYDLTEEQQMGIRKILEDAQKNYEALYINTRPALDQIRRAQQMAIRETMTEKQAERFDKWLDERRKRQEAGREGRGERVRRDGNGGTGNFRSPRSPKSPAEETSN